jgi:hypothetical protein
MSTLNVTTIAIIIVVIHLLASMLRRPHGAQPPGGLRQMKRTP